MRHVVRVGRMMYMADVAEDLSARGRQQWEDDMITMN